MGERSGGGREEEEERRREGERGKRVLRWTAVELWVHYGGEKEGQMKRERCDGLCFCCGEKKRERWRMEEEDGGEKDETHWKKK